jgi:hypothetical protein
MFHRGTGASAEHSVIIGFAIILYPRNLRAVYCESRLIAIFTKGDYDRKQEFETNVALKTSRKGK